jgi:hypothetical protein
MTNRTSRGFLNGAKWWWNTRVVGLIRVRIGSRLKQIKQRNSDSITFAKDAGKMTSHTTDGITVILTAYKRQNYLQEQIEAVRQQSIKPVEIWV